MMKQLLIILSLCATVSTKAQLTKIGNVDAYVYNPNVVAPILIAGHGNGEAGSQGGASALLKNGLPKLLNEGFKPSFPVYILCPQDGYGTFSPSRLPQLISDFKAKYPLASTEHIYITGYSAGGVMAFNSIAYITPLAVIPMSSASNDNNLVNAYAQKKIPVYFYVGETETNYKSISEWAHYLLKQAGANSTITVRKGVGHCCWNDIYQSAEFWNLIKPIYTNKDTTINRLGSFTLPSGTWTVKSANVKLWGIVNNVLTTMEAGTFVLNNGQYDYKITFVNPPVIQPIQCYKLRVGKYNYTFYAHPDKNVYRVDNRKASPLDITIECDGNTLTIKKDWTWEQK